MIREPHQFDAFKDRYHSGKDDQRIAAGMWRAFVDCSDACEYSIDFEDGFIQGAAETLRYGCSNHVPLVPDRRYWHRKYRNPAGRQAVADWFAGYEAGMNYVLHTGVHGWNKVTATGGLPPLYESHNGLMEGVLIEDPGMAPWADVPIGPGDEFPPDLPAGETAAPSNVVPEQPSLETPLETPESSGADVPEQHPLEEGVGFHSELNDADSSLWRLDE
jgi:hypothetical protein